MGQALFSGGGGGGVYSEDCTATANDILKGKTAFFNDSDDDIGTGTLELTGDAADGYVYKGKTYYNTDAHTKRTGTMTVGSILNFSAAAYSGRQVLLKWQNPYAATGKPFGGVFINYSTSSYPGTGGTRIYTGYGNNTASGGWSQIIVTLPNLNTTYYFSCTAYATCSVGDIWGNTLNANCKTSEIITQTITSSQNYTVPAGYNYVDIFCVGGGGGGAAGWESGGTTLGYYVYPGGGGGGGYTSSKKNVSVSSEQVLNCVVGSGGAAGTNTNYNKVDGGTGGTTSVSCNGSTLCSANGGGGAPVSTNRVAGNGGSGGGQGEVCGRGTSSSNQTQRGGNGGSNGSEGYDGKGATNGGTGQSSTTRPFGEDSGTIYSGGGGGGYGWVEYSYKGGYGGNYGGGNGGGSVYVEKKGHSDSDGDYTYPEFDHNVKATAGGVNTGGGGGGGGVDPAPVAAGCELAAAGGSGVVILRLH